MGHIAELLSLDRLVAGIAEGRGDLIWVRGEPGIGKTALVNAALARASGLGRRVLRGNGDELMEPFPLRLMADCRDIGTVDGPFQRADCSLLRGVRSGADSVARHLLAVPGPIEGWALGWLVGQPETALYTLPQARADLPARAIDSRLGD